MGKKRLPKTATVQLAFEAEGRYGKEALDALYDRLLHADEISEAAGIRPARHSVTDIFKEGSGITGCRIELEDLDEIRGQDDCELFAFPKGTPWLYRATVYGRPEDVASVFKRACGLLGIACYMVEEYGEDLAFGKRLEPEPGSAPSRISDVLRDWP